MLSGLIREVRRMSIESLSQIMYIIGKNRPSGTSQAHNNVILCCHTVGNTFWREAKYDAWLRSHDHQAS